MYYNLITTVVALMQIYNQDYEKALSKTHTHTNISSVRQQQRIQTQTIQSYDEEDFRERIQLPDILRIKS